MNTNEIVLKWNKKRKGRSSSWFKEKGGDGSNSVFFLSLMIFIYLNSLRVKDFSYGDSPLERYLIWFSYFKYGTCLFNGTSRQQAYSCMWPSTRPILGAKGWTNSRGLVHWGQHHMKPLALPFVGLWMEYGWKVSLASLVNRPWLVFSLVPTAIELRYLYSWNKTDLHEDLIFLNKIGHFHIEVKLHMRKIILDYESCPCVVEPGLPPGGQPSTEAPILI